MGAQGENGGEKADSQFIKSRGIGGSLEWVGLEEWWHRLWHTKLSGGGFKIGDWQMRQLDSFM